MERGQARPRRRLARAFDLVPVAALLAVSPGCSLILTRGPPASSAEYSQRDESACTESVAAPVADTVIATALLALTAWAIVEAAQPCPHPPQVVDSSCGWNGLLYFPAGAGGLLGALFTTSAVVGYSRTAACRESRGWALAQKGSSLVAMPSMRREAAEDCARTGDAPRRCALAPDAQELLHPGAHP